MVEIMSKTGTYHASAGLENQDVALWGSNERYMGLFLADGMSDCPASAAGADTVCRAMRHLLLNKAGFFFNFNREEIVEASLDHIRWELESRARAEGRDVGDYSSTFACALLDKHTYRLLVLSLGDSLVAGVKNGRFTILAKPDDSTGGCCGTATQGAETRFFAEIIDAQALESVFLCSDGAWRALFRGSDLTEEAARLIEGNAYDRLAQLLRQQEHYDDCSMISMML